MYENQDDVDIANKNGEFSLLDEINVELEVSNGVNVTQDGVNVTPNDASDAGNDKEHDLFTPRSPRQNEYTIINDSNPQLEICNNDTNCTTKRSSLYEPVNENEENTPQYEENATQYAEIIFDQTTETPGDTIEDKEKTKFLRVIFRPRAKKNHKVDEISENFYNPPSDVRGNYFIGTSRCPVVRVLLTTIAAIGIAVLAFYRTSLSLNLILSISIAIVLFIIVFVVPLSLPPKSCICVLTLIFPSIFSARTKIAGIILLVVLLTIGPIIGIANKLHLATWCKNGPGDMPGEQVWQRLFSPPRYTVREQLTKPSSRIQENCITIFKSVDKFCNKVFKDLQNDCRTYHTISKVDSLVCEKEKDSFCQQMSHFEAVCSLYRPKVLQVSRSVRHVLSYLAPLLVLLLFSDAYTYNKMYLTIKEADNVYITKRLRELDRERKSRNPSELVLPLTRIEFQAYVLRGRFMLSKNEKNNLFSGVCVFLLLCLVTSCLIFTEHFIHVALYNSLEGSCREIYKISTDIRLRNYIYILLGVILFMTLLQSYMLRLRSIICDHFYPLMVDVRANHLYYRIIHDRNSFGRHMRRKIQLLAEAKRLTRRISCTRMLYKSLPRCFKMLCCKLCVRVCMVCDSVTYSKTVQCGEGQCQAHYCYECYVDAGQKCLTCTLPESPVRTRHSVQASFSEARNRSIVL